MMMGAVVSFTSASSLAFVYVGSLYIWKSNQDRDSPYTIRRRFLSAFFTVFVSTFVVRAFGSPQLLQRWPFLSVIGIRTRGLFNACVWPLALTAVLFAGPLTVTLTNHRTFRSKLYQWRHYLTDLIFWRNYVVAPFTEEYTFRACMLPIMLGSFSPQTSVYTSPWLFGIAHFHHMIERMRNGLSFTDAFMISSFQLTYTTIFGIYSAFLYIRTGHLASCIIVHTFCNSMGFPDLMEVYYQPPLRRAFFSLAYVAGLGTFIKLLPLLTDPALYANDIFRW